MRAIRFSTRTLSSSVRGSKLYSWGKNETGELGRDVTKAVGSLPALEEKFPPEGVRILSVAAASRHALAATTTRDVYAWGSNKNHVLGLSKDEEMKATNPMKVPGLSNVVEVSAGDSSSAALTRDGQLYTWGFPGSF